MPIYHIKTSTVADGTATATVRPSDWDSAHTYSLVDGVSLSGNTAGVQTVISSGTLYLAGGNNITLSQNANSVTISNKMSYASSYENMDAGALATMSVTGFTSQAVAFFLPTPISVSFIRLPVQMTTSSQALGVQTVTQVSFGIYSTVNAVVYSLGTGANSRSLQSVASGSNGWTCANSLSLSNSSHSHSQYLTFNAEGGQVTTSTQYSQTSNLINLSTTLYTAFSGARFLDIAFNNSLDAGAYWLIFGISTSSFAGAAAMSNLTWNHVRYTNHYGASQVNSNFGVMGSSNLTSGGYFCCGSFSTGGGGTAGVTTASLPLSAISTTASMYMPYFQMLRSA